MDDDVFCGWRVITNGECRMSLLPRKISWSEPWDWELYKNSLRQCYEVFPPMWRMGVYCLIVFGVFVAVRMIYPETQDLLRWKLIILLSISPFFFFGVLIPAASAMPVVVYVTENGVCFQGGGGSGRVDVKNIISLSFETRDGRRYFVVKARNKKGLPYERLALMAKKKIAEEDVKRFLYDVNLAHLFTVPNNGQNEKGNGQ